MKIMKLSRARQINKSRELGVLLGSTLMQRRILYSCLSVMNPIVPHLEEKKPEEIKQWMLDNGREADALRTYHIDITDFAKVWGLSGAKDLKGKLEDAIGLDSATGNAKIMNLCFKHKEANEKSIEFINVMSKVRVDHENGILTVRFTDDIMPFLINLASYTTIPLRATVGFKCNYSFGMLEHLLKRYTRGSEYPKHTLSLEALHATLGTDHVKSYKQWGNFKKFVLEPIERDFALVDGGGYELLFTPVYATSGGRGRRKVEGVEISFNNKGVRRFNTAVSAKKSGLDLLTETVDDNAMLPEGAAEAVKRKREQLKNQEKIKEKNKQESLF